MNFTNTLTSNWENAFRGLRHPYESYNRSDSQFGLISRNLVPEGAAIIQSNFEHCEFAKLGPNDIDLAQRMIKAGSPNDKFLRQIFVSVDITAPLYWWKEMDTYKVATTANSTSTMHKLANTPITKECFELGDYNPNLLIYEREPYNFDQYMDEIADEIIEHCENLRRWYIKTKDIRYWKELIRWLPESWLQTRTWTANYATLKNIYYWRHNHKLTEWHQFCDWIKQLPYADELLIFDI